MTASILPFVRSFGVERHQSVTAEEAALVAQTEARRLAIVNRHARTLFGTRSELNRVDDILSDRAETYARSVARFGALGGVAWTPPFAPWLYWVAMLLMLVLEIPVNAAAIDLLRLPEVESVMLATFFAIANIVAAKYTGRALRQWSPDHAPVRTIAIAVIANISLLAGLFALARMRAEAVDGAGSPWAFLVLQLMFYAIALFAAYMQTSPIAEAEQDAAQLRRVERQLRRAWTQRARLARVHNVSLARIQLQVRRAEHECARRVAELRARRWPDVPGATPLEPITTANFQPLDLGEPVDHHPVSIDVLVPARRHP